MNLELDVWLAKDLKNDVIVLGVFISIQFENLSQFLDQLMLVDSVGYLIENQDRLMEVWSIHRVQSAEYGFLKCFLEF